MIAESKDIQKLRAVVDASYESLRALKMETVAGRSLQGQMLGKNSMQLVSLTNFKNFKTTTNELKRI